MMSTLRQRFTHVEKQTMSKLTTALMASVAVLALAGGAAAQDTPLGQQMRFEEVMRISESI